MMYSDDSMRSDDGAAAAAAAAHMADILAVVVQMSCGDCVPG
jgi:hypothetical protein